VLAKVWEATCCYLDPDAESNADSSPLLPVSEVVMIMVCDEFLKLVLQLGPTSLLLIAVTFDVPSDLV
jgi:hypothetical protein